MWTPLYGGYNLPPRGLDRVMVVAKTWRGHVPTGAPDIVLRVIGNLD